MASERLSCPGPSRRDVLRIGTLGVLGLGLADFFRLKALANPPLYETPEIIRPRATSCILVWQSGGPSHIDTWDPKPDAPKDVKGEFNPIDTAVAGIKISEVLPNLAQTMDKLTVIRSMTSPEAEHDRATHHMLTGYRPSPALVYPSYGSVMAKIQENRESVLPAYVAAPEAPLFSTSGYLTPAYNPFEVGGDPNGSTFRVRDLTPPDELTLKRLRRRQAMVNKLDDFAKGVGQTDLTRSRDKFSERAYDLITSADAQKAFQLETESNEMRERYGRTTLGQTCLLGRRLVEAGVPFVTINDRGMGNLGWDTHGQNFQTIKTNLAPAFDKAVATLVRDLEERGLLETTLVIAMGEFGRTPKINGNAGRDHHGRANSIMLAGAGLPRGVVIGKTDPKAEGPVDRPTTPSDLAATIYHLLGINPEMRFHTPDGQPIRLVDKGTPIKGLV